MKFAKPFTQQLAIPESGIERAIELLRSGRLHRYNTLADETSEASLLEQEFADWLGVKHCLACASGGYAMHISLKAAGIKPGEKVLTNAFTLAPVPGAINNAGADAVLVESDQHYRINLQHLEAMAQASGSRYLLLSHMRGHLADMDAITQLCQHYNITLIEDCAHTMGARWNNKPSGTFGHIACFSTQTYKHINSGEGGLLTTNDPEIAAKAIMYSGSYMLHQRHGTAPSLDIFSDIQLDTPNYSGRMDNLRAAILRAQLPELQKNCQRWHDLYHYMEQQLTGLAKLELAKQPEAAWHVGSSIQFRIPTFTYEQCQQFIRQCGKQGVELKWFGSAQPHGFTSRHTSWRYLNNDQSLPYTTQLLATTFDMRIPLTFDQQDLQLIATIIGTVVENMGEQSQ